jgi:hypothetical protein
MTNSTHTIDFNNITTNMSLDINDIFFESNGEFNSQILFHSNGLEISVDVDILVSGDISIDRGDYWTPTHKSLDISDISCEIKDIYIDGYELELNSDIESIFLKEIKKIYKM